MVQTIKPFVEYKINLNNSNIQLWGLPPELIVEILGNGRQLGVVLESVITNRFSNLTQEGCSQGEGADIRLSDNSNGKIQCKTVRFTKKNGKLIGYTKRSCRITKSCLWDKTRGKAISAEDWDSIHNSYFPNYDYFMFIDISTFKSGYFTALMIPTRELHDHSDIPFQQTESHFGVTGRKKLHTNVLPDWSYPKYLTRAMWDSWANNKEEI